MKSCTGLHVRPPGCCLCVRDQSRYYLNLPLPSINVHNTLPAICTLLVIQGPAPDHHLQQVVRHCKRADAV